MSIEKKKSDSEPREVTQDDIDHFCQTPFDEAFVVVAKRRGDIKIKEEASS